MGRWFGINENESLSNEEDEHAEEIPIDYQNAPHESERQVSQNAGTQNSQTPPIPVVNLPILVNEAQPRARRHFVIPRQRGRSKRILKSQLAKQ